MSDGEKSDSGVEPGEVGTSSEAGATIASKQPATPDFAPVNVNGDGDAAMLAAMARPLEQEPHEKMSLKAKIVHEFVEVGGVILYLFVSFAILETFRCGTLLAACSQNDFISGYTTAVVAALGLGKFVFVLDKLKVTQRYKDRPLIVPILYKTVLFTILSNLILHAEDRILHRVTEQPHYSNPTQFMLCAFTHQLAFLVMFFIFFCFRGVAHVIGEKRMFRLFFVSRDEFISSK
jgi:hypothetical protein